MGPAVSEAGEERGRLMEMLAGPIVRRELDRLSHPRTLIQPGAVFLTLVVVSLYQTVDMRGEQPPGTIFDLSALIGLTAVVLMGAVRGALELAREREMRTLDLLLVTPMGELSIVTQTVVAVALRQLTVLASPFLLIMVLGTAAGEASPEQLVGATLVMVVAALVGTSLGVAASTTSHNAVTAVISSLLLAAFWMWAPVLINETQQIDWYGQPGPLAAVTRLYLATAPEVALTYQMVGPSPFAPPADSSSGPCNIWLQGRDCGPVTSGIFMGSSVLVLAWGLYNGPRSIRYRLGF